MTTKWTAPGIFLLLAVMMTFFSGCRDGNGDGQAEPDTRETARLDGITPAEKAEFGEIHTVDMGGGFLLEFVEIPDTNAGFPAANCPDGAGFTGEMGRHPVTNAQYAQYLNEAMASGDVIVDGNQVTGASGSYSGHNYYRLDGAGQSVTGAVNGGKSRISYSGDGVFTVDSGFEEHPVTYVSWYGATSFAEYYGWRLPTAWEWESVANFNDNRNYATGNSLHGGKRFFANYRANGYDGYLPNDIAYHPYVEYGTTPAGYFGYYGYGLADMSGNVWEWTSTSVEALIGINYLLRGGSWNYTDEPCGVSHRYSGGPGYSGGSRGFRVCR